RYSAHYYFSNADRRYNDNVRDRVRHRTGIGVQYNIDIDIGEYCDVECIAEYCCVVVGWRDRFLVPDTNINHNLGQWTCPHVPSPHVPSTNKTPLHPLERLITYRSKPIRGWVFFHYYLPAFSSKGMAKFLSFELGLNKR